MSHFSKGSEKPAIPKHGLRLYSMRFCPYAERSRLVLAAKGVDFECCNVNLKNKPDWFFELNPTGTVPVMEFSDGRTLYESMICCEYLEEVFQETLLFPKDPIEKNKQRILIENFGKKFVPLAYKKLDEDDSAKEQFITLLTQYEKELAARKSVFYGGEKPGMLDYMIWPWFERMPIRKATHSIFQENPFPALKKWNEAMKGDPAAKACAMPMEWHAEFLQGYMQGKPESQLVGADKK